MKLENNECIYQKHAGMCREGMCGVMLDDDPGKRSHDLLKILLLVSLVQLAVNIYATFFK